MKVLIADDEQHVRATVRALLEWEGLDEGLCILEADDGESAIRIIREESPELLLTDIVMPHKNGIDLLQWIHDNACGTKTIVISGHDHFSFVRSTLKLGGADYLLKPIDADEMAQAVRRAMADLSERDTANAGAAAGPSPKAPDRSAREAYWDFVFAALLEEDGLPGSVSDHLAEEMGIPPGASCSVAVLARTETGGRPEPSGGRQAGTLLAETKRAFCPEGGGYAVHSRKAEGEVHVILWDSGRSPEEKLTAFLRQVGELPGRIDAGLGRPHKFPDGLSRSLREARAALRKRNLLDRSRSVHLFEEGVDDPVASHAAAEGLTDLKRAVVAGDADVIRRHFDRWFAGMKGKGTVTPAGLELAAMEWHIAGLDWLRESVDGGAVQELMVSGGLPDPRTGRIEAETPEQFLDKWSDWFAALSAVIRQGREREKERSLVSDIKRYIDEHYREPISLRTIAGQFHFTREHISRKFRKETGLNLSDYLHHVRIAKAQELLLNPELRVREVGELVGIPDEKYFSRMFKKLTGVSPNDYRKSL